jgi:hypothetical protein
MKELKHILSEIARKHLLIPTLEPQRSDSLDFHQLSVWAVQAALEAAYEAGREDAKCESIDIYDLLATRNQIAHFWAIDDVQYVRPDLNDDQAWQVLQTIDRRLDSEHGITWETIEIVADDLFGHGPETDEA